jgi:DMSO/TMAO reductase YedYZ molybdopterin-dependent catalytic subunit
MDRRIIYTVAAVVALVIIGSIIWNNERRSSTPTIPMVSETGDSVEVTPTDKLRVRTAEAAPVIDLAAWRLEVSGLVDQPITLSFPEIEQMEAVERQVDLPCVEGWTDTGLWKGVRLKEVLDRAGLAEGAETVVFSSPGGYTSSLTVADIDQTDPMLAYGVNGERLPDNQGFPLRLVVPDRYGYKWVKWVTGIEVIQGEYEGYWESRGYSNDARIR